MLLAFSLAHIVLEFPLNGLALRQLGAAIGGERRARPCSARLARGHTVLFPSITFLFYFLPLFFIVYCVAPGVTAKNLVLLAASLLFYAWGEPRFVLLLAGADRASTMPPRWRSAPRRATAGGSSTALGVAANLALLGTVQICRLRRRHAQRRAPATAFALPGLALPLGISFFTFHAISYLIDVHRGGVAANRNPLAVAVYIAMFPQLVAGPIIRYHTIARRLAARRMTLGRVSAGLRIFVIGLAQKVLIADEVARVAEAVFDKPAPPSLAEAWLGLVRLHHPDLFRFRRLFQHGDRARARARLFASRAISACPTRRARSPNSGAAGTSACRSGCATTSTFRSAATAAATPRPIAISASSFCCAGCGTARTGPS